MENWSRSIFRCFLVELPVATEDREYNQGSSKAYVNTKNELCNFCGGINLSDWREDLTLLWIENRMGTEIEVRQSLIFKLKGDYCISCENKICRHWFT